MSSDIQLKPKTHGLTLPLLRPQNVDSPSAGFVHGDWHQYERVKRQIIEKNLSAREYEMEIGGVCKFLGI